MSRTDNVVRIFKFSVLKYILQILLKFVLRTAVIYVLGKQYLGLNGLFSNILGILNLAELGIGSAIVFSMYKPIAKNEIEKVKTLNNLYKKIYMIIASIILVVGLAIMPFLKYLIEGDSSSNINIYLVYFIYLINTVISYFAAHKRSLIFAYQRDDITNKIAIVFLILLNAIQIALLFIFKNYYAYLCLMPVFTLIESIVVIKVSNKLYPDINGKSQPLDKKTKKEITKNIAAMSMHKIGDVLVNSTDNILISSFIGLAAVGVFSNYGLLTSSISSLILVLVNSLRSSAGNLVATCEVDYVYKRYKMFNFAFAWIAGFCTICLICLSKDFISLWTGDNSYLLPLFTVIAIMINFYLISMRYITSMFKNVAGLMIHDVWKPIVQGLTNVIASIILAQYLGFLGVILGTTISSLIAPIWVEPYVLYKHYFKKSVWKYLLRFAFYTFIASIACVSTYLLCSLLPSVNVVNFIIKMIICVIVPNVIFIACYFWMPECKSLFSFAKTFLTTKIFKKKQPVVDKLIENNQIENEENISLKNIEEKNEDTKEDSKK